MRSSLADSCPPAADPRAMLRRKIESKHLTKLTKLDVNTLDGLFRSLSASSEAALGLSQFTKAIEQSGLPFCENEDVINAIYGVFDVNHDGGVDKRELICGLSTLTSGSLEDKLRFCFKAFDENGDGFIQPEELESMLHASGGVTHELGSSLNTKVKEFVAMTFANFDDNKDGQLSIDEFMRAAREHKDIAELFTLGTEKAS